MPSIVHGYLRIQFADQCGACSQPDRSYGDRAVQCSRVACKVLEKRHRERKKKITRKLLRGRAFAAHMSGQCESMAPQYSQSFRSSLQGLLEAEMDNWHEASTGQQTKAWPSPRDAP